MQHYTLYRIRTIIRTLEQIMYTTLELQKRQN